MRAARIPTAPGAPGFDLLEYAAQYPLAQAILLDALVDGYGGGHIDLPRARAAGMAGGFFAIFPPPAKTPLSNIVAATTNPDGNLPPELPIADAQASTNAMAALMFRLERQGALAVDRQLEVLGRRWRLDFDGAKALGCERGRAEGLSLAFRPVAGR